MNTNSKWILPLCLVLGAAVFGLAYTVMRPGEAPEGETTAGENKFKLLGPLPTTITIETKQAPPPVATKAPATTKAAGPGEKGVSSEKSKPKEQPTAFVRDRSWVLPSKSGKKNDADDEQVIELVVNEKGTRVIAKSKVAAHCFDLTTGQIKRSYPSSMDLNNRPDPLSLVLFPGANFVATVQPGNKPLKLERSFQIQAADTGVTIGKVGGTKGAYRKAILTSGSNLLVLQSLDQDLQVQTIAASTATDRTDIVPGGSKVNQYFSSVVAIPRHEKLLVYRNSERTAANPSALSVLDLQTGTDKPLTCFDQEPWCIGHDLGIAASPDGKWVLTLGTKKFQIADWRANRRVFDATVQDGYQYRHPVFTPDGKRLFVQRVPRFRVYQLDANGNRILAPASLELFDIASQKKLSSFVLTHEAESLAISGDGKTIVFNHDTTLNAIDFQSSFELAPLSPLR